MNAKGARMKKLTASVMITRREMEVFRNRYELPVIYERAQREILMLLMKELAPLVTIERIERPDEVAQEIRGYIMIPEEGDVLPVRYQSIPSLPSREMIDDARMAVNKAITRVAYTGIDVSTLQTGKTSKREEKILGEIILGARKIQMPE